MKNVLLLVSLVSSAAIAQQKPVWVLPEVNAPRVQRVLFDSPTAGQEVSCYVFTPESYDTETERRFPVLYWLHGSGGSTPAAAAQVARRYGEAMKAGQIPPMIMVFPNGLPMGMWCDWRDGSVKLETMFIEELIPHTDRRFRTLAKREGRIIEGFSMGGYGAARLGFKYSELFAAVSLLGAGPLQFDFNEAPRAGPQGRDQVLGTVYGGDMATFQAQSPWRIAEQNTDKLRSGVRIRQIVGDRDETLRFNRDFKQHLDALKIPHTYRQLPNVPHNPNLVLEALGQDNWAFYNEALTAISPAAGGLFQGVSCEGFYKRHVQGICTNGKDSIYWCWTDVLVKTDTRGRILRQVPVADHHGDLCHHNGRVYVATNLGKFNEPPGQEDSWVYVYDADTLAEVARHPVPELVHGAGGMAHHEGKFILVGGLPLGVNENYVYEYDEAFRFLKRHILASGHTEKGIQTVTFADGAWWFGCYGDPAVLLRADEGFRITGRWDFNASVGIVPISGGRFLIAQNTVVKGKGNHAETVVARMDEKAGLVIEKP